MHGPQKATGLRALGRIVALCLVSTPLLGGFPGQRTAIAAAAPVWPIPDLVADLAALLGELYRQRADASTPVFYLAPEWESDKWRSSKDPDTLWEYGARPETRCHEATTMAAFVDCTGHRLALAADVPYRGGLSLFDPTAGFAAHAKLIELAGICALYHAYVRDHDATLAGAYSAAEARDAKRYHEAMMRAYEAHMRDILLRMFRDTRHDPAFQFEFTLGAGWLALAYVRTVQALETVDAWADPEDRRSALALVNGLNQRLWWEWIWPQTEGPRTAGFVDLGSEATQAAAAASGPGWVGTDRFRSDGGVVLSLRPSSLDEGPYDGLWVDADYAAPGEWWCYARYGGFSTSLGDCLGQARKASLGGSRSPFGQYYGQPGTGTACGSRASNVTPQTCGVPNRGSIALDWVQAFLGARLGMFVIRELAQSNDAHLPAGAIGLRELPTVTSRLGYGVAGWHGGANQHDDLEWPWSAALPVVAIRTLSAARHDLEPQDGRFSLGETDTSAVSVARRGDTWSDDQQEFPGAVERQAAGPSPFYGPELLALVLSDRTSDGLAGSFYDAQTRDEPDEFDVWLWLLLSSFYRCPGVSDPADGACVAFSTAHWPNPAVIRRVPLFSPPADPLPDARFRNLWLNPVTDTGPVIGEGSIADRDMTCRGGGGLPWQHVADWTALADSGYLVDEAGQGPYDSLIPAFGSALRLLAARYAEAPPDPALADDYERARSDVLAPWYEELHRQVKALLVLYRDAPPAGFRYLPGVENSTCIGFDPYVPGDPSLKMVLSWQGGTSSTRERAVAHRAIGYSRVVEWYWCYSDDWLTVDATTW